jgi:hypothetical protein
MATDAELRNMEPNGHKVELRPGMRVKMTRRYGTFAVGQGVYDGPVGTITDAPPSILSRWVRFDEPWPGLPGREFHAPSTHEPLDTDTLYVLP